MVVFMPLLEVMNKLCFEKKYYYYYHHKYYHYYHFYYYYYHYYCYNYFCHYLKYLALKAGPLRQVGLAWRSRGSLTQAVKQPHSICYLTWGVLKGVQWCNVNNMKLVSKNINSLLSLSYQTFV